MKNQPMGVKLFHADRQTW